MDYSSLPDDTPVIVGVGQFVERLEQANYRGLSAVEIAAEAGRAALADAGADFSASVDLVATTRTFEHSGAQFDSPFGRTNNFPRSLCQHLVIDPADTIWEDAGGNTPLGLVSELCERIASGANNAVLVAGAEAISTMRHLARTGGSADWSETVAGSVEDRRGQQTRGILSRHAIAQGLLAAPPLYGLCENARRGQAGMDRAGWRLEMARWFAPFTRVASENPYSSMSNRAYSAEELATIGPDNRLIADPYPRLMVARDQVNQGAALLLTRFGLARQLGVAAEQCVFLHGYAALREKQLEHRPDLGAYPAGVAASEAALASANIDVSELAAFDFYSCFPIAVTSVAGALGLGPDDPRGLTVTGGLPYFGGPGNNYSMHAIASLVERLRGNPGSSGFVGANGGFLSKYAAGVFSTRPRTFRRCDSRSLQQRLDAVASPPVTEWADGPATIETFTILHGRDGAAQQAIIVGRQQADDVRFIASTAKGDTDTAARMAAEEPLQANVAVHTNLAGNFFRYA